MILIQKLFKSNIYYKNIIINQFRNKIYLIHTDILILFLEI